ncbi:hypothetical protein LO762_14305 [Actinocorallia sp. API 0066]|uniref:hypothetical protein n=1 Tax=Actinocorallia sp. API 0066 TaxID=2896846 RepID=UPI001E43B781|nr:hypothetical protein [Actinocorallia sp. API 0066]MCD0450355.1 hypothetical protein [Actinocorallia sp. API 0066]
MQCPECRSETPGSLGRCTRCDAPLPQADEAPWTPQVVGDQWPPEPWRPDPAVRSSWRPPEPVEEERQWPPEPQAAQWREQQPERAPWPGPERSDPGWGGAGRPEAWGGPPPQQPVPPQEPPHRSGQENWIPDDGPSWRGPLLAGLVAALLTGAVVVGYVFWKGSDDPGDLSLNGGQSTSRTDTPDGAEKPEDGGAAQGDAKTQAATVDDLLDVMTDSRAKLATITYTCANKDADIETFSNAIEEREGQLGEAADLDLSALPKGAEVKAALQGALQASIDSNKEALAFLKDEDGCDGDAGTRLKDATDRATATKRTFLDLWNPIAEEHGLSARTRDKI